MQYLFLSWIVSKQQGKKEGITYLQINGSLYNKHNHYMKKETA